VPYVAIGCRAAIVTVFLIAVAGKTAGRGSFREFTGSVVALRVIPPHAAAMAAAITVTAEALVIVLAVSPAHAAAAAGCALAAALSVTFSCAVAMSIRHGNRAPCRCFGRSAAPLGTRHFTRNAILLAVSAVGVATSITTETAHIPGAIAAGGAGLFVGLVIAAYDDIAELIAPSP
jgi:hypothetical protein